MSNPLKQQILFQLQFGEKRLEPGGIGDPLVYKDPATSLPQLTERINNSRKAWASLQEPSLAWNIVGLGYPRYYHNLEFGEVSQDDVAAAVELLESQGKVAVREGLISLLADPGKNGRADTPPALPQNGEVGEA
jgi:hypothetical protein